jgi:methylase of polypeptide subunit release factors
MIALMLTPYVQLIENRLIPDVVHYGIFHRLSGEVFDIDEATASLLANLKATRKIWIDVEQLKSRTDPASLRVKQLIAKEFLISEGCDPLVLFADQFVVRPIQNPALGWRAVDGRVAVARTSTTRQIFSPQRDELPEVIEEFLPPMAGEVFLQADGTKTLREIFAGLRLSDDLFWSREFRSMINLLTSPDRQLVKFTSRPENLENPFAPCNIVPRNLYRSRTTNSSATGQSATVADFHLHEIADAQWEFDLIEPTINHAFRFPSEALGGFEYGARFCCALTEVLPEFKETHRINVLEVGGGTGTFARSFTKQARATAAQADISYNILELSPTLIQAQTETLSGDFPVTHFQQDATEFSLPGHKFDLIIANEVIADFPTAAVRRAPATPEDSGNEPASRIRWEGEGAADVDNYELFVDDAPDSFLINSGVFRFIERAWEHLAPGGVVIVSEYGGEQRYPIQEYQLNHEEFSIHFGHVATCARKVGFSSRLVSLKKFLDVNDEVLMLNGREEHILCIDRVLQQHGLTLPYAAISQREFEEKFREVIERMGIVGITFSPLSTGFHYGPDWNDFLVLILQKPS